jgi:hypothetical protein
MTQFHKATRHRCKIKLAVQGTSGSGKTYSSLLLAHGLTGDWSKIAVIDTENGSSNLYAHLGDYSVLPLSAPFSPEKYCEAIELAVSSGFECLIIDSLSHEWNGAGGILDIHSNIPGNSFTAWAKVTPRHNACLQSILQSDLHVIATMRSKTEYVLSDKNGKQVPEKVGMKATQREDSEYEFTIVFELNHQHQATVSKDRTGLFGNTPELKLTYETGRLIENWCNTGKESSDADQFRDIINSCHTMIDLITLYNNSEDKHEAFKAQFAERKHQILNLKPSQANGQHY